MKAQEEAAGTALRSLDRPLRQRPQRDLERPEALAILTYRELRAARERLDAREDQLFREALGRPVRRSVPLPLGDPAILDYLSPRADQLRHGGRAPKLPAVLPFRGGLR